jgi:MFS family permease
VTQPGVSVVMPSCRKVSVSLALGGYAALFRIPRVRPVFAWVSLSRLQFGVIPLALLLLLAAQRQSYAEAGAATAGYALTAGLLGPLRAHLADRHGHGRTLVVLTALNAAALLGVVALASAPLVVLVLAAVLAGCLPAPVGPVMRSTWRELTSGEEQLQTAYSLDTVTEEVLFVVGPLVAAAGVARFSASAVLTVSVGLLFVSAVGLWRTLPSRPSDAAAPGAREPLRHWRSLRFLAGLAPAVGIGVLLGAFDLAAIAAAIAAAGQAAAGLPAALLSIGSVVGGLAYGRRRWPGRPLQQAVACVALSAGGAVLAAALTGRLVLMLVAVAVTGLFVAPSIVASYLVADAATAEASAETTSWVNSAFNVGTAGGTALAGVLIDARSPSAAILAAAAAAVVITAVAAVARRASLAPTPSEPHSPPTDGP